LLLCIALSMQSTLEGENQARIHRYGGGRKKNGVMTEHKRENGAGGQGVVYNSVRLESAEEG
jgi:hypothetical protein